MTVPLPSGAVLRLDALPLGCPIASVGASSLVWRHGVWVVRYGTIGKAFWTYRAGVAALAASLRPGDAPVVCAVLGVRL